MEFWDLYRMHGTRVYNFLLWQIGRRDDAEDLTGAIFLKARERFDSLCHPEKAEQWLWAIVRNAARNFLRDRKETVPLDDALEKMAPVTFSDNGHQIIRLKAALSRLSIVEREIIVLREYQGFSYAELAQLLQTTVAGVKSRLYRARENLRQKYFQSE